MILLRIIICLIFFGSLNDSEGLKPRYAAIVIDAKSGKILDEENADILCHPASLAKMATLYMVFEALKSGQLTMATKIRVSAHAARQIPCKLGLRPGESITVETVIKGMVTKSANDAAAAIAEYLGGSEVNFAAMMTRKARSLGMRKTIFKNASGVPNPHQVTTAREMAILSQALYRDFPKDCRHFRLTAFHHRGQTHRNHNHLLGKVPGLDGIKTGFVNASGSNLAASAVRTGADHKPKRLIVVVLGGSNRHVRDRRVTDLLEINFKRLGLEQDGINRTAAIEDFATSSEEEFDLNEAEVDDFLKEAKSETSSSSLPEGWSAPQAKVKNQGFLKHTVAKLKRNKNTDEKPQWGVQIGTYRTLQEARRNAKKIHTLLKTGEISLPRVTKGKKVAFGARLLRLTHDEAETTCQKHALKGKECRILSISD